VKRINPNEPPDWFLAALGRVGVFLLALAILIIVGGA
jgi:hypothetical protein